MVWLTNLIHLEVKPSEKLLHRFSDAGSEVPRFVLLVFLGSSTRGDWYQTIRD